MMMTMKVAVTVMVMMTMMMIIMSSVWTVRLFSYTPRVTASAKGQKTLLILSPPLAYALSHSRLGSSRACYTDNVSRK